MKLTIFIALFAIVTIGYCEASEADDAWEEFKKTHTKNYGADEHDTRKAIFLERYQKIAEHNKRADEGKETYKQKINQYADLTNDELNQLHPRGIKLPKKKIDSST